MKKVISLILALVLCLSLCACGGGSNGGENNSSNAPETSEPSITKATVITNENTSVEMTAEDLFNEFDANEARFDKLYRGASIEFTGTVKAVKTNTYVNVGKSDNGGGSVKTEQHKIVFEEGWCLIIGSENTNYDLADYYPGQILKVSTGIATASFDTEFLQDVADNSRVVWLVGNERVQHDVITNHPTTITVVE